MRWLKLAVEHQLVGDRLVSDEQIRSTQVDRDVDLAAGKCAQFLHGLMFTFPVALQLVHPGHRDFLPRFRKLRDAPHR